MMAAVCRARDTGWNDSLNTFIIEPLGAFRAWLQPASVRCCFHGN
jgi:hypothetical protein